MQEFFHSVTLDKDKCMGCINCIKRCPTEAIRVRNKKAHIIPERCIDCGECIRVCPHHAKRATCDSLDVLRHYEYVIALPAPSFMAQFNNLEDVDIVLNALLDFGFDSVFEVAKAAELVSAATRQLMKEGNLPRPVKVTATKMPLGTEKSAVDAVVAVSDIYTQLLPFMKQSVAEPPKTVSESGKIGLSWGSSSGEASGLINDNYLAADGIENVIRVLDDLEDEKFRDVDFIELNACSGGCVGGVLNVENPYVARTKLYRIRKHLPVSMNHIEEIGPEMLWDSPLEYVPVLKLDDDMGAAMEKMARVQQWKRWLGWKKLQILWRGWTAAPAGRRPAARWRRMLCADWHLWMTVFSNIRQGSRICCGISISWNTISLRRFGRKPRAGKRRQRDDADCICGKIRAESGFPGGRRLPGYGRRLLQRSAEFGNGACQGG